jgi:hypothetical protein
MLLPLLDGVFAAVVLAGGLSTITGIIEVGLLIFGGSATLAVILAEMDGDHREVAQAILAVGAIVIIGAILVAALAPTIRSVLDLAIFERFAAVIILAIAARTASSRVGEVMPRPAIILGLGLLASLQLGGATLAVQTDPELILRAAAAAGVGVAFALAAALGAPWLRNAVDIDRFRFGSAVALGVLPLSILGYVPPDVPIALAVLLVTTVLALNPGRATEREEAYRPDSVDVTSAFADGGASQGVQHDNPQSEPHDRVPIEDDEGERLPWL